MSNQPRNTKSEVAKSRDALPVTMIFRSTANKKLERPISAHISSKPKSQAPYPLLGLSWPDATVGCSLSCISLLSSRAHRRPHAPAGCHSSFHTGELLPRTHALASCRSFSPTGDLHPHKHAPTSRHSNPTGGLCPSSLSPALPPNVRVASTHPYLRWICAPFVADVLALPRVPPTPLAPP
jgi:hypothetical protein